MLQPEQQNKNSSGSGALAILLLLVLFVVWMGLFNKQSATNKQKPVDTKSPFVTTHKKKQRTSPKKLVENLELFGMAPSVSWRKSKADPGWIGIYHVFVDEKGMKTKEGANAKGLLYDEINCMIEGKNEHSMATITIEAELRIMQTNEQTVRQATELIKACFPKCPNRIVAAFSEGKAFASQVGSTNWEVEKKGRKDGYDIVLKCQAAKKQTLNPSAITAEAVPIEKSDSGHFNPEIAHQSKKELKAKPTNNKRRIRTEDEIINAKYITEAEARQYATGLRKVIADETRKIEATTDPAKKAAMKLRLAEISEAVEMSIRVNNAKVRHFPPRSTELTNDKHKQANPANVINFPMTYKMPRYLFKRFQKTKHEQSGLNVSNVVNLSKKDAVFNIASGLEQFVAMANHYPEAKLCSPLSNNLKRYYVGFEDKLKLRIVIADSKESAIAQISKRFGFPPGDNGLIATRHPNQMDWNR